MNPDIVIPLVGIFILVVLVASITFAVFGEDD